MKRTMITGASCLLIGSAGLSGAPAGGAARGELSGPFPIRGYHQHIFPDRQPMKVVHARLETLSRAGYNLVAFGMGSPAKSTIAMHEDGTITPNGCSTKELADLVAHAVDLGLEPVFEMKFIGKQLELLKGILKKHPGLVIDPRKRATVLDATYRLPDGRDAYAGASLALVDYLLSLYPADHPAKYFFLGIDEFSGDDMAELAERLGMSPAQAFAYCLNRGTDHLLAKGITPLVWGDTMLSPTLGTADHGLTLPGYRPDPRLTFRWGGAYHAIFGRSGDHGLHRMVNHLRDRDKIIVVDWHYAPSPSGEFPSVDYFQQLGFKDVWGAPWDNEVNIRQLTRYAAGRGCGGMLATAWHDAFTPEKALTLRFIIGTSAALFANPALEPAPTGPVQFTLTGMDPDSRDDEKRTGSILATERKLRFRAAIPEPIVAADARLLISAVAGSRSVTRVPLRFSRETGELTGQILLPESAATTQYQLRFSYTDAATGYVYVKEDMQGFVVTDRLPEPRPPSDPSILLEGDFRRVTPADLLAGVWLQGTCSGPLGWARARGSESSERPRPGGLDLLWLDRVWVLPSAFLNATLARGMRLHLEARMAKDFAGKDYCALFTKGSFHTGFRVLVGHDRHLLFQFAGLDPAAGGPLWVKTPPGAVPLDRWVNIDLLYRPPAEDGPGLAEVVIDGKSVVARDLARPMPPSTAIIGIGCEFGNPTLGPNGKKRPNFPGSIRKVTIRALSEE